VPRTKVTRFSNAAFHFGTALELNRSCEIKCDIPAGLTGEYAEIGGSHGPVEIDNRGVTINRTFYIIKTNLPILVKLDMNNVSLETTASFVCLTN
jgi:hypothetical protein